MPAVVAKSIAILSDAGLGMAMFSLGTLRDASAQPTPLVLLSSRSPTPPISSRAHTPPIGFGREAND
jgi:hypothetical protein